MRDLAVVTVTHGEPHWVCALLPTVLARIGEIDADVVVVDNAPGHPAAAVVDAEFPEVRTLRADNHGFGHANNRALYTCDARYVLFINPDTEILDGTLAELVAAMDRNPRLGLAGCRQVTPSGRLDLTIRYFPNALRALGEALAIERVSARRPRWLGERELDPMAYQRETACDWTSGSFMLARREALQSAGWFDERYFMFSEEIDLCRRIKLAGWEVGHLPRMTILHHDGKAGVQPRLECLSAASRMIYARKFFSPAHQGLYRCALMLRHGVRAAYPGGAQDARREASRQVLRTLAGRGRVPFDEITSGVALNPSDGGASGALAPTAMGGAGSASAAPALEPSRQPAGT